MFLILNKNEEFKINKEDRLMNLDKLSLIGKNNIDISLDIMLLLK